MASSRVPVFQERFKALRGELTQAQFADKLGLSRPTVGLYESGQRIPDAEVLQIIASKCGVSADYLLGFSETESIKEDVKACCAYTGLTEKAVERLHNDYCPHGYAHFVSELIGNFEFLKMMRNLYDLTTVSVECDFSMDEVETAQEHDAHFSQMLHDLETVLTEYRVIRYEINESLPVVLEKCFPSQSRIDKGKDLLRRYQAGSQLKEAIIDMSENGGKEND